MWLGYFLKLYWKTLFLVFYPLLLLLIFIAGTKSEIRCLYVMLLMIGYWITEALPSPVTGLIPMILFPCLTLLDSSKTAQAYLGDTNMLFLACLMIAVAIEHCGLHRRIALRIILRTGSGIKRITFGLMLVSMFTSMWIANTATVALMCPVASAVLDVLEKGGIQIHINKDEIDPKTEEPISEDLYQPSNITKCIFISLAYSATIGGMGALVGSGTNITFVGLFLNTYPKANYELSFLKWLGLCFPIAFVTTIFVWLFLCFFYLGFLRPKSNSAINSKLSPEQQTQLKDALREDIETLGPITYKEINMTILFILVILLFLTRDPSYVKGWAVVITEKNFSDSSTAIFIVILIFLVPASTSYVHVFSKDKEERPTEAGPALCTWSALHTKVPWGIVLLIGSSFALAEGSKVSGLTEMIGKEFDRFKQFNQHGLVILWAVVCCILTQLWCNIIVCNVVLPIIIQFAVKTEVNPLYLCLPSVLSLSLAFTLPASTPPNAMVQAKGHLSVFDFIKCGLCITLICFVIVNALAMGYGRLLYDFDEMPFWTKSANIND